MTDRRELSAPASVLSGPVAGPKTGRRLLVTRFGWIATVTVAVTVGAGLLSWSHSATYKAQAEVLVGSGGPPSASVQLPEMGTEKTVVSSDAVLRIAAGRLQLGVNRLRSGLSVGVPLDTHILDIGYTASDPATAQARANAVAAAYVTYWGERQAGAPAAKPTTNKPAATTTESTVITPAVRPTSPASPNHILDVIIGLAVGLALGFASALLRDRLDDRLRGADDLELRGGAPVLCRLPSVRRGRRGHPLRPAMLRAPESRIAGTYRDLRTRVFRAATRTGAKTLLVTSPGNEAKSAVAANLAIALAEAGKRIVLVSVDPRRPTSADLFGAAHDTAAPAPSRIRGGAVAAVRNTDVEGVQVLPGHVLIGERGSGLQAPALRGLLGRLQSTVDFVIIDAPPVLRGPGTGTLAEVADLVLVVADAKHTLRRQVADTVRELARVEANVIGFVLDGVGRRTRLPEPTHRPSAPVNDLDPLRLARPTTAPSTERTFDDRAAQSTVPASAECRPADLPALPDPARHNHHERGEPIPRSS